MRKTALIIVDGMGIPTHTDASAIRPDTMPFFYELASRYGCGELQASGEHVGIAADQAGNSEVGHLTIGAGRKLETALNRIRRAFGDGSWAKSEKWRGLSNRRKVHVAGLLSGAGVHAHYSSIVQTAKLLQEHQVEEICLHLFLDGVDSPAGTAVALLESLINALQIGQSNVRISSISGRKWATDRSGKIENSRHVVTGMKGEHQRRNFVIGELADFLRSGANESGFDFHYGDGSPLSAGDCVILTSHRADRATQLAKALTEEAELYSLVELDTVVPLERVFFPVQAVENGLVDALARSGVTLHRIAESCKFPHVTFFMNGMRDLEGDSVEIKSIGEEHYRSQPEMRISALVDNVLEKMRDPASRALVVNIPNLDQIGHTGDLDLAMSAARHVNQALETIYDCARALGWSLLLTADHGNADRMVDTEGRPVGSHSTNPVPLIAVDHQGAKRVVPRAQGTIANVAASFLDLCGVQAPASMEASLLN